MKRALIAIVDAAHARLYTYQQIGDAEPTLNEQRDLVNAGRQAHAGDVASDNIATLDARFAKLVVTEAARIVQAEGFRHVILVASPKMLGELRRVDAPLRRGDILIDEIAQDLAWLTSPQIHDHLAAMKLVDPRPRAASQRSARTR